MIENVEIISVNYCTPDLIERLIKSVRDIEGNYPIRIIDGSDREPFKTQIKAVCDNYTNVTLQQLGYNIHHGRGMDLGVSNTSSEWVLIIDSDNFISQPTIENMLYYCQTNDKKICAYHCWTNSYGLSYGRNETHFGNVLYYHPALFLIRKDYYVWLKANDAGFIHHGAPCIAMMNFLHKNKLSTEVGVTLADAFGFHPKYYGDWVNLESRGTVNRFGYNL